MGVGEVLRCGPGGLSVLLCPMVPLGCAMQCSVTEGKDKVDWKCRPVLSFAAEPFKVLEIQIAACAGFICATIDHAQCHTLIRNEGKFRKSMMREIEKICPCISAP